ncbi:MAG TPA: PEP-CTERM sorting domain-containing protein [Candidatus Acidoferrum sp.]|nr:PEP-CTERM sorting domain-containing protein [Candidatus Acidoferrum sp.]
MKTINREIRTPGITILRKTEIILVAAVTLLALSPAAKAQSLGIYYNLQSYGTVANGNSIVDALGNTTATVNNDANTSLTSSGLTTVSASGNSASTGVTLASGSISGFTGSFSIQDWVTIGNPNNGVVLWGANNGPANTFIGDGYTGVSTLIGFSWGSLAGGGGTGNPLGQPYNRYGNNIGGVSLTAGQTYDMVLTYDASTYTFNQYINGTWTSSLQEAFSSTSLAGTQIFGIGGCPNEPWSPWGDATADATTKDFLLYNGVLAAGQVSALDAAGAGASLGTINAVVPEPGSFALMALAGVTGLFFRRSIRSSVAAR